jgi:hypothetical protein
LQVIRLRTTRSSRCRVLLGQARAVGLACLAAAAGEGTPVREKIQFSGTNEAVTLPSSRPKADLLPKAMEFLDRGNSVSGVVAPAVTPAAFPSYQRNTRVLELFEQRLDQKRNWIFGQPSDFGRTPSAAEVFDTAAFGGTETKPKTALERFLAGSGRKAGSGHVDQAGNEGQKGGLDRPGSRIDQDDRHGEELSAPLTNPYDSSRMLTAGFSIPNEFFGRAMGPALLNDFLNSAPADPAAKARDDRKHADEFRKVLNFSGPANPLTSGLDRIDLGLDLTRPELNTVTAPRLGELPGAGRDAFNPLRAVSTPPGARLNELDSQNAKILGPSSLAPAVSAPANSPIKQPSPTVSEFPKRNF